MRLRHLRYFVTVAEELNLSRASERLRIQPSPLSRAIRDLEYDVGVNLLHRTKGNIRLTWAGELFRQDARRLLSLYDEAKNYARKTEAGNHHRIRIGIADSLAQPRLISLLTMCREEEPLTTIGLTEMTAGELLAGLNRDLIDVGITVDSEEIDGIVREAVWSERPVVALPRHHPLLSFDRIPFREVLRYPLILCHPELCAGGYKLFRQWLKASGYPPYEIAEYIPGHERMMMLVSAGYGVGFGLETQAAYYRHPDIVLRPVTDELTSASTYIVTSDLPNPPELERFIERARRIGGKVDLEGDGAASADRKP
ncbi:LysR substrate-binding domain-containing protein [Aquamicrobium lusatiense]|uniref:LysR family transcriptional regulator n=1 Tax=Aquamicrobium lusatiense TaxID=89772 RepID=UPI0024590581|nr:LysR family transcriptional regulator [Aquamicrobium lusatiense]MDH4990683.1 LysR substrate-binding domain-containing protein [Aquamicrobium lusatiense]